MNNDKIMTQFERYCNLLNKVFPQESVESFLEDFAERLALCPRGLEKDAGGTPGALIEFSLNVAQKSKEYSNNTPEVKSAVRVALVHELGRLGDLDEELYYTQDSSWHQEKLNQYYKYNKSCTKMNLGHRALYLLQKYKFDLTQDEWISIAISQGLHMPENAFYGSTISRISACLQFSRMLTLQEDN